MLRTALIQLTAAGVLAAAPAWALNANPPQSDQNGAQQSGQSSTQSRTAVPARPTHGKPQAGGVHRRVRVPDSFLVHAKDRNGNPVAMFFIQLDDLMTAVNASVDQAQGGKFTDLPSHDELSTKAVGANAYNSAKQEIGSIKDVAIENNRVRPISSRSMSAMANATWR